VGNFDEQPWGLSASAIIVVSRIWLLLALGALSHVASWHRHPRWLLTTLS
jgi:hypothetical protein